VNSLPSLGALSRQSSPPKPFRKLPPWLVPAALALGFFLLFLALFSDRLLPAPNVLAAVVLTTSGAASGSPDRAASGRMLFQASGWIEPDPYAVKATSLIDGVVETVAVLEGQRLEKGEVLATLIDTDARLALAVAEQKHRTLQSSRAAHLATISSARKRLQGALAQVDAAATLSDEAADRVARFESMPKDAIPATEVVSARLRVVRENSFKTMLQSAGEEQESEILRLELETQVKDDEIAAAAIEVEQAKLALSRTRIVSPIAGRVLRLHAAPGQKKMLEDNDPDSSTIAVLYDPEKVQVRVDVPLADAAGLYVGQAARIRCSLLPDKIFEGEVTRITGEADFQRNTLQAKVRIVNPVDSLRPEMLCRVEFLGDAAATGGSTVLASWVPEAALVDGHVWTCDPETKRITRRAVEPANETRDGFLRIASGVSPGEWVILSPKDLREGQRVKPTLIR
jgi:HlyD family secretion protein